MLTLDRPHIVVWRIRRCHAEVAYLCRGAYRTGATSLTPPSNSLCTAGYRAAVDGSIQTRMQVYPLH